MTGSMVEGLKIRSQKQKIDHSQIQFYPSISMSKGEAEGNKNAARENTIALAQALYSGATVTG